MRRRPCIRIGVTCLVPMYPMIPHMIRGIYPGRGRGGTAALAAGELAGAVDQGPGGPLVARLGDQPDDRLGARPPEVAPRLLARPGEPEAVGLVDLGAGEHLEGPGAEGVAVEARRGELRLDDRVPRERRRHL